VLAPLLDGLACFRQATACARATSLIHGDAGSALLLRLRRLRAWRRGSVPIDGTALRFFSALPGWPHTAAIWNGLLGRIWR